MRTAQKGLLRATRNHDGWQRQVEGEDGAAYLKSPLAVITSVAIENDGRIWFHVSVSIQESEAQKFTRLPTWDEMVEVKETFMPNLTAYQVMPPRDQWISIADVLHLWACLEGPQLPDFSRGGSSI